MNKLQRSLLASALLACPLSQASVLLYEPFDYAAGSIAGKGGSETGFDASSTWSENSARTTEIQAGSMNFGTLVTTGSHFHYNTGAVANADNNRVAYRGMNLVVGSGDLYITYLMQGPNGVRLNGGAFVSTVNNREFGALRSPYNTTNSAPPSLIYGAQSSQVGANVNNAATYMYVQRYTGLGSATGGTAQLWVVAEADYNTIALDGLVTVAELDANNFTSTSVMTLTGAAPTLGGAETLRLHLHDSGGAAATDFHLDEVRIATTLGEAMAIVPEPSAFLLAGFGALLGLKRRRTGA